MSQNIWLRVQYSFPFLSETMVPDCPGSARATLLFSTPYIPSLPLHASYLHIMYSLSGTNPVHLTMLDGNMKYANMPICNSLTH